MYKKIVLLLCFLVAVSCSSPSSPSSGSNGINGGGSGSDSGNTGDGGDSGGIPWTEIAPPLPVLDDEAKTYGIDISQEDSIIKEQIKTKLEKYKQDKGVYKVIFTGTPKAEYMQKNSLAKLVIEVANDLDIYKNIEIDIRNIYFNERKIKSSMFKGFPSFGDYTITFTFPENTIRVIEKGAFSFFSKFLEEITIPDSVITIESTVFQLDHKLSKITFNKTSKLEYIGYDAFANCPIKEIVIPASVKTIGSSPFEYTLTTVTYLGTSPNAIQHNGDVFDGCTALKTLIVPNAEDISDPAWTTFLGGNFTDIRKN